MQNPEIRTAAAPCQAHARAQASPGPWKRNGHRHIADAAGNVVCEVFSGACESLAQADANEALIAAGPAMLAKLRALASECANCQGAGCDDCADIHAVITTASAS